MHELVVADLHPTISIGIQLLEGLRKGLDHDTSPDETIERDAGGRGVGSRNRRRSSFVNIYPENG